MLLGSLLSYGLRLGLPLSEKGGPQDASCLGRSLMEPLILSTICIHFNTNVSMEDVLGVVNVIQISITLVEFR